MIDILINHFLEPPEMIGRLLKSIQNQIGIDLQDTIKVYIFSDGLENSLSKEFLESFSYPIVYEAHPHYGVCVTRNALLTSSHGEYVMFCDADDCFYEQNGLATCLRIVSDKSPDIVSSVFLSEFFRDDSLKTVKMYQDVLHLHGKIFKRSFINENLIRFPDEMETTGDMFFLWLAFHLTKKIQWIPDCFYVWKWNEKSITRSCMHYGAKNYHRMVRCYTLLTEYLINLNRFELLEDLVSSCVLTFYLDWHSDGWNGAPDEYIKSAQLAICKYAKNYLQYFFAISEDNLRKKYIAILFRRGIKKPNASFYNIQRWIDSIQSS